MEWHTGSTLSQTVYTFLYGHAIAEMHLDYLLNFEGDSSRPMELVTVVLRAVALTVMKTCGVAWAGMAKGGIHDVGELTTAQVMRISWPIAPHSKKTGTPRKQIYLCMKAPPSAACLGSWTKLYLGCHARQEARRFLADKTCQIVKPRVYHQLLRNGAMLCYSGCYFTR